MKKQEKYRNLIRFGFSIVIWGILTAIWAYFWETYYTHTLDWQFYRRGYYLFFGIYAFLLMIFNNFYGGSRVGYYKRWDIAYSGVIAMILCNIVTYVQISLLALRLMDLRPFLVMVAVQAGVTVAWAFLAHGLYSRIFQARKLLMVYGGERMANSLIYKMLSFPEKYSVMQSVDIGGGIEPVLEIAPLYDGVILCDMPPQPRNQLLKFCFEHNIRTYTTPKISDILVRGGSEITLFDTPLLLNRNEGLSFEQRFLKRIVDIILPAIALLLALPLMLVIAAAIWLCDRGPVFYKQKRLTIGGKEFSLYKFRSMIVDAENQNGAQLSTVDDARITYVGRVIRMLRLDELPQLLNILKGDMSIVGPRPERPELALLHLEQMPEFDYRLKVKAGLTGFAQTVGRYNTTPYDKLKLDLMYIMGYSLFMDFKLMLMTVKILFVRESTQGVANVSETHTEVAATAAVTSDFEMSE